MVSHQGYTEQKVILTLLAAYIPVREYGAIEVYEDTFIISPFFLRKRHVQNLTSDKCQSHSDY